MNTRKVGFSSHCADQQLLVLFQACTCLMSHSATSADVQRLGEIKGLSDAKVEKMQGN